MMRLLLAGAGHAHALVLRSLALAPLPGVEVVVVSPHALAPYSGMVPGWLAGRYRFEETAVDFRRLCAAAGARWVAGEIAGLDPDRQRLQLASGETLGYGVLSLNVGSTLRPPPAAAASVVMLPLRPLAALRERFEALLERLAAQPEQPAGPALRVTAVGGGAAGFEALLAVLQRLRQVLRRPVQGAWVGRGTQWLPGLSAPARRAALRALQRAGVALHPGTEWQAVATSGGDGAAAEHIVLWATGAEAHDWQRSPGQRGTLAVDEAGFVRINAQLQSLSHPQVWAAGDCAAWGGPAVAGLPGSAGLPKAGVHAVRMGPVLAHNLRAACAAPDALAGPAPQALRTHRPQSRFLMLLATADGRAIASRGRLGAEGRWAWHWKDRIDRRFIARFNEMPPRGTAPPGAPGALPTPGDPA